MLRKSIAIKSVKKTKHLFHRSIFISVLGLEALNKVVLYKSSNDSLYQILLRLITAEIFRLKYFLFNKL